MKAIQLLSALFAVAFLAACDPPDDTTVQSTTKTETTTTASTATEVPPSRPALAPPKPCCDTEKPKHDDAAASDLEARMKRFAAINAKVRQDEARLGPMVDSRDAKIAELEARMASIAAGGPMRTGSSGAQTAGSTSSVKPGEEKIPVQITLPFLQQVRGQRIQAGTYNRTVVVPVGTSTAEVMKMTKAKEIEMQRAGYKIDKTTGKLVTPRTAGR